MEHRGHIARERNGRRILRWRWRRLEYRDQAPDRRRAEDGRLFPREQGVERVFQIVRLGFRTRDARFVLIVNAPLIADAVRPVEHKDLGRSRRPERLRQ